MKKIDQKLLGKIQKFLEVQSRSDGGWAPVSKEDFLALGEIIDDLIHRKWETDPDGDVPVTFDLLDHTVYEYNHYFKLPHAHKLKTDEEFDEYISYAATNVEIAAETLGRAIKIKRVTKSDKVKK